MFFVVDQDNTTAHEPLSAEEKGEDEEVRGEERAGRERGSVVGDNDWPPTKCTQERSPNQALPFVSLIFSPHTIQPFVFSPEDSPCRREVAVVTVSGTLSLL